MTDNLPVLSPYGSCVRHTTDWTTAVLPLLAGIRGGHRVGRRTAQICCKSERRLHEQELCAPQSGISATAAPRGATCTSQRALLKADHNAVDFLVFGGLSPHPVACSQARFKSRNRTLGNLSTVPTTLTHSRSCYHKVTAVAALADGGDFGYPTGDTMVLKPLKGASPLLSPLRVPAGR